ncbi:MAG: hypothetical protein MKZ98_06800 [Pseudomonadales bacterium]|nr:hypothetical protein [Pseudomonadales bacterium]
MASPDRMLYAAGAVEPCGDCALRGRQVAALTPNIELPTVIHATNPTFFIATEEEIGPTVRAPRFYNTNGSVRIAEGDEVFAQQTQTLRWAIRRKLLGKKYG